jgi:hypothetical protein
MTERQKVYLIATAIVILSIMGAHKALGDDVSIKGGAGIINNVLDGQAKYFGVRNEFPALASLTQVWELGGYVDNAKQYGRKSSLVGKYQIGVTPGPNVGVYTKAFLGPCLISTTDAYLGGHFQFCEDFGLGVRDMYTFAGLNYGHISSAGLESPNKGRDWVTMEMGVRF